jgi:hypothetical protein
VQLDLVDGADGRVGIGIGGEQDALGLGRRSMERERNSMPVIWGILWSASNSATGSPRSRNRSNRSSAACPELADRMR